MSSDPDVEPWPGYITTRLANQGNVAAATAAAAAATAAAAAAAAATTLEKSLKRESKHN